mmetsp:Transcript_21018/g.66024  ORF Transcript_21018/g.66024 Transcript_21018/m.66024 type:complete len:551 (+) Transcript_21018:74-1726(+)
MTSGEAFYVLVETAAGYALLDVVEFDEIASMTAEVQRSLSEASNFMRCVKLKAFIPFASAEMALENINAISEHGVPERLEIFLEQQLPSSGSTTSSETKKKKKKKKGGYVLGVVEPDLGKAIAEATGASVRSDEVVREIIRGARQHASKLVPELGSGVLEQSQLGLGHAFSRAKVKFNPARADNMIIQSIGLLDTLDKDINTFAMRCKEWYSWHFPELRDLVRDNFAFARAAAVVGDRGSFLGGADEAKMAELADAVRDRLDPSDDGATLAESVRSAARMSMGMDCSAGDMANIMHFTRRMVALATYRVNLGLYLGTKMLAVAPNLATLVGESVAARLISKAGSLASLAKCPASTVQILGAEKALFRALKTKHDTPKYGLIYHASLIGQASPKNKGKISRVLAAKCSLAARVDALGDDDGPTVGPEMRAKVEARLRQLEGGAAKPAATPDNKRPLVQLLPDADAPPGYSVASDLQALDATNGQDSSSAPHKKKKKTKPADDDAPPSSSSEPKKSKKKRKADAADETADETAADGDKKKKKAKKKKDPAPP